MVRTIAMDGTEGLVCGQRVLNTGSSISVPVGRASLDHIMNVIEEPIDEKGGISSGYEREDSSGNEVEGDSSGLLADAEAVLSESVDGNPQDNQPNAKGSSKIRSGEISVDLADPLQADFANYILKHKSVFKCRLCPRIVCLNEPSIKAHLESKRHARSKKLLTDGRLKLMLNSDGEIEEEQETHSERHARTLALAEKLNASKKRDAGRQRQSWRRKKRSHKSSDIGGYTEKPIKKSGNKRPKIED